MIDFYQSTEEFWVNNPAFSWGWRVSKPYTVTHMTWKDVDQCYPFLYGAAPSATLEIWRHFCAQGQQSGHTILVAHNADRYIQGVCAYFETEHLSRGRLIEVPFLLVASAVDSEGVASALVCALRQACNERSCAAVRVSIPPQGWTDPRLFSSGEPGDDDAIYFSAAADS